MGSAGLGRRGFSATTGTIGRRPCPGSGPAGRRRTFSRNPAMKSDRHQRPHVVVAADQRDLGHDRLDPAVDGPDDQYVAAGVAAAPDADPAGVGLGQGDRVGDGVPVVADLRPGVDLQTGRPVAVAEVPVVEDQRVQSVRGEHLGELVQVHLLDRGEAVGHDDRRGRFRCCPRPDRTSPRRVTPSASNSMSRRVMAAPSGWHGRPGAASAQRWAVMVRPSHRSPGRRR